MIQVDFKLDRRFQKRAKARFERFEAEVGILQDKPHFRARPASKGLTSVDGGPARKRSRVKDGKVSDVGENIRTVHQVPYLTQPFRRKTKELRILGREIGNLISGKSKGFKPLQTALQRLIKEPIRKQKYGRNSRWWAKVKTFNRKLIDTAQFYRALTAKVRRRRVSK